MHENKRYNRMVLYVEACESGSMFQDVLPDDLDIYATTAANSTQSSWGCYWNDTIGTALGDVYSVKWMEGGNCDRVYLNTFY